MAQADFDFLAHGAALVGGSDGTARLHTSLSSALAGEGLYCRDFTSTLNTARTIASIKSTVNGGEFFEIPSTKAVSVRAWLRTDANNQVNNAVGITAKLNPSGSSTGSSEAPKGYSLFLGATNQASATSAAKLVLEPVATTHKTVNISSFSTNVWYKFRLDVIPISTAEDIVRVYTGTGTTGSEIWTLRHTETVLNTDLHYVPWGESGAGKVGFFGMSPSGIYSTYIDRFQVFLEDV